MVKIHHVPMVILITLTIFASVTYAQSRQYHLEQEGVKIWINQNGTIDLFYNISITLDSGPEINYVHVGQPTSDFTIGSSFDQYGHPLEAVDASEGSDFKVRVNLYSPLQAGQTRWFTLLTNVAHMLFEDTMNPGNVGMQFVPTWWPTLVHELRVMIVLPPGVTQDLVKTSINWTNTLQEDDQLALYWEKNTLAPNEKFPVGVSFPKEYVQSYDEAPTGIPAFIRQHGLTLLVLGIAGIGTIGALVYVARNKPYLKPRISIETLGIRRGLTAVEASYLLELQPTRIVTEILYSLLKKRAIWVESTNPSLKLKRVQTSQDKNPPQKGPLRYYEIDFLNAVKEDGTLDEERLAQTVLFLRNAVEEKMRGYRRRDTITYYRKIVSQAWNQVEQAGTPDLASKAYDEKVLWLFLDPKYQTRTNTAFRNQVFQPNPLWWWYWYSYTFYHPKPQYTPNIETPAQAKQPPNIPGADFANNIATAVESTSNNIVTNLEKFANAILPKPPKSSTKPARHDANCVCACASCACVCACVSCACACASGGVGLKGRGG